jgi:hypothetical protein
MLNRNQRGFVMAILAKFSALALALGLAVGVVLAAPASAQTMQTPKQKKSAAARSAVQAPVAQRGADKFPAGPVYFGADYLGTDPDPFIRSQILRDLGARYPGNI